MTRGVTLALLVGLVLVGTPDTSRAAGTLRRFILVTGANRGGDDRAVLRFALTDAERFNDVMTRLGGVEADDAVLLKQPRPAELEAALTALEKRVVSARRQGTPAAPVRTEVFFYYSGHADEKGLLLGNDRYAYLTLRDRLDGISADVRIAVLDACASGAFTQIKGGKLKSPFMVDAALDPRGHAFLTSSAANEAAQESERIGGSFFTHYLVSGLRGAADVSADGRVTLNEAYQFAHNETLSRTVGTRGGAQHARYEMSLSGSGDVVLTDLRQTTAGLILAEPIVGRFYVLDRHQRLALEFYKPAGRRIEVGLEAGTYEVRHERDRRLTRATIEVRDDVRVPLDLGVFVTAPRETTRLRGEDDDWRLLGRHMVDLRLGLWQTTGGFSNQTAVATSSDGHASVTANFSGALGYLRFVREDLAVSIGSYLTANVSDVQASGDNTTTSVRALGSVPIGVRWNPLQRLLQTRAIEPYVATRVGPVFISEARTLTLDGRTSTSEGLDWSVTGHAGGGVDFRLGRSWMVGVSAGYNWTGRLGLSAQRSRYNGAEMLFTIGVLIGPSASVDRERGQ